MANERLKPSYSQSEDIIWLRDKAHDLDLQIESL